MAETIRVQGEGGAIFMLDLPLHEAIEDQITKGTLTVLGTEDDSAEPEDVPVDAEQVPEPEAEKPSK